MMPAVDRNPSRTTTFHVRLETLPASYEKLIRALGGLGLSGTVIQEIISNNLLATCATCGISVTGNDLTAVAIAVASAVENLSDPRLVRLAQGYCCRRGCDSYYYCLELTPHPALDLETFATRFADAESTGQFAAQGEEANGISNQVLTRRKLLIQVVSGATFVFALFAGKALWPGGSRSRGSRQPKYTADPASLPTVPRR
jgi:hypothetical protein